MMTGKFVLVNIKMDHSDISSRSFISSKRGNAIPLKKVISFYSPSMINIVFFYIRWCPPPRDQHGNHCLVLIEKMMRLMMNNEQMCICKRDYLFCGKGKVKICSSYVSITESSSSDGRSDLPFRCCCSWPLFGSSLTMVLIDFFVPLE